VVRSEIDRTDSMAECGFIAPASSRGGEACSNLCEYFFLLFFQIIELPQKRPGSSPGSSLHLPQLCKSVHQEPIRQHQGPAGLCTSRPRPQFDLIGNCDHRAARAVRYSPHRQSQPFPSLRGPHGKMQILRNLFPPTQKLRHLTTPAGRMKLPISPEIADRFETVSYFDAVPPGYPLLRYEMKSQIKATR
jgi:hypothetical protein